MEDIESNLNQDDQEVGTSDLFDLEQWEIPNLPRRIASITTSRQFTYIITQDGEILRWVAGNSDSLKNLYSLPTPKNPPSNSPEKVTKIFCDRSGNHAIIKHEGRMYYFNGRSMNPKELPSLKGIEVYAVAFDEKNTSETSTGEILISDHENKIYSYSIEIFDQGKNKDQIKENIQELIQINKNDIIYGLQVK
ncbi:MAG: hypothetical protein MJ252_19305 [archaeon]|nr:hypothetical protein [archaeon]